MLSPGRNGDKRLCDRRNGGCGCGHIDRGWNNTSRTADSRSIAISGSLLRAVSGDVSSFATLVAGLARSVQGAAVGGSAVARNMAQLAASIALHGLSLAISREVVGATTLVASSRASTSGETATSTEAATEASTSNRRATGNTNTGGIGACASQVARLTAVVAPSAGTGATQTQGRAVSLNMAESLAMIALLGLGCAGEWALVRLVA